MADPTKLIRSAATAQIGSLPADWTDITKDSGTVTGEWTAIHCFGVDDTTFPNDDTSIKIMTGVEQRGVNMSIYNTRVPNGCILYGFFTQITLGAATSAIIRAYKV